MIEKVTNEIFMGNDSPLTVVELGSGVSSKTTVMLKKLLDDTNRSVLYVPVDVDPGLLTLFHTELIR